VSVVCIAYPENAGLLWWERLPGTARHATSDTTDQRSILGDKFVEAVVIAQNLNDFRELQNDPDS
jgi:hypothetical protein